VSENRTIAPDARALFVVHAEDSIVPALTGHGGMTYVSPAQPYEQALALVGMLLGGPRLNVEGPTRWTRPIAGGRRRVLMMQESQPNSSGGHEAACNDVASGDLSRCPGVD
jgi:hypothetical protein